MVRARDLGIPFGGNEGRHNAITDVDGVEVGYSTLIIGEPEDYTGDESNFARTGVTAILPRGKNRTTVVAGRHSLNGNGELTGTHFIDDYGMFHGPVMLTNTFSLGVVRDAAYKWFMRRDLINEFAMGGEKVRGATVIYPVVGETYDGMINNARGFLIDERHAFEAIESAAAGPVQEGNVGGGTGMQAHLFKGGSGTASRVLSEEGGPEYTVGVFVQANHGYREAFNIRGIPFGQKITGCDPVLNGVEPGGNGLSVKPGTGSIIAVLATDAPLTSRQLSKLCKRIPIGMGLLGGGTEDASGDIFLGFSTAHSSEELTTGEIVSQREVISDDSLDLFYRATVEATEEAILNAMVAAETMVGINGNTLFALPHDQVRDLIARYQPKD